MVMTNALKAGHLAAVVCGGAHDLTVAVRRAADNGEYIRVASFYHAHLDSWRNTAPTALHHR
jgi:hypothetical protein